MSSAPALIRKRIWRHSHVQSRRLGLGAWCFCTSERRPRVGEQGGGIESAVVKDGGEVDSLIGGAVETELRESVGLYIEDWL